MCTLSCTDYVFICVAHIIIKVSIYQKLQLDKKKKERQSLRAGMVGSVRSVQRSLSDKVM